ncbi:MAG: hypothetical protein ACPIOQ_06080, partial [Promethearchaeia archaeon]
MTRRQRADGTAADGRPQDRRPFGWKKKIDQIARESPPRMGKLRQKSTAWLLLQALLTASPLVVWPAPASGPLMPAGLPGPLGLWRRPTLRAVRMLVLRGGSGDIVAEQEALGDHGARAPEHLANYSLVQRQRAHIEEALMH